MKTKNLKAHPAANLFPEMDPKELEKLTEDIGVNGQQHPILLFDDMIIDGRHRYRACQTLGIIPDVETYDGNLDPVELVLSLNLHRRHLDASQRAMVAESARGMSEEEGKKRKASGKKSANLRSSDKKTSAEKAAKLAQVSTRSVEYAAKVRKKGIPELATAVQNGRVAVSKAAQIADLPPEEQSRILAMSDEEIRNLDLDESDEPLPTAERAAKALATWIQKFLHAGPETLKILMEKAVDQLPEGE